MQAASRASFRARNVRQADSGRNVVSGALLFQGNADLVGVKSKNTWAELRMRSRHTKSECLTLPQATGMQPLGG